MKYGVINYQCDQSKYTEQNGRENDGQRPKGPREISSSYVLYGVAQ